MFQLSMTLTEGVHSSTRLAPPSLMRGATAIASPALLRKSTTSSVSLMRASIDSEDMVMAFAIPFPPACDHVRRRRSEREERTHRLRGRSRMGPKTGRSASAVAGTSAIRGIVQRSARTLSVDEPSHHHRRTGERTGGHSEYFCPSSERLLPSVCSDHLHELGGRITRHCCVLWDRFFAEEEGAEGGCEEGDQYELRGEQRVAHTGMRSRISWWTRQRRFEGAQEQRRARETAGEGVDVALLAISSSAFSPNHDSPK